MRKAMGRGAGGPLLLKWETQTSQADENGKVVTRNYPVFSLEPRVTMAQAMLEARETMGEAMRRLLPGTVAAAVADGVPPAADRDAPPLGGYPHEEDGAGP